MSEYHTAIGSLIVKPKDEPIFSELATKIEIDDEAAGPFICIIQDRGDKVNKILLGPEEWPHVRKAIERMVKECPLFGE